MCCVSLALPTVVRDSIGEWMLHFSWKSKGVIDVSASHCLGDLQAAEMPGADFIALVITQSGAACSKPLLDMVTWNSCFTSF